MLLFLKERVGILCTKKQKAGIERHLKSEFDLAVNVSEIRERKRLVEENIPLSFEM